MRDLIFPMCEDVETSEGSLGVGRRAGDRGCRSRRDNARFLGLGTLASN